MITLSLENFLLALSKRKEERCGTMLPYPFNKLAGIRLVIKFTLQYFLPFFDVSGSKSCLKQFGYLLFKCFRFFCDYAERVKTGSFNSGFIGNHKSSIIKCVRYFYFNTGIIKRRKHMKLGFLYKIVHFFFRRISYNAKMIIPVLIIGQVF